MELIRVTGQKKGRLYKVFIILFFRIREFEKALPKYTAKHFNKLVRIRSIQRAAQNHSCRLSLPAANDTIKMIGERSRYNSSKVGFEAAAVSGDPFNQSQ